MSAREHKLQTSPNIINLSKQWLVFVNLGEYRIDKGMTNAVRVELPCRSDGQPLRLLHCRGISDVAALVLVHEIGLNVRLRKAVTGSQIVQVSRSAFIETPSGE